MSFNLGQFRKDLIPTNNYLTSAGGFSVGQISVQNSIFSEVVFKDAIINLDEAMDYTTYYYIKIKIKGMENFNQNFLISLTSSALNKSQYVGKYTVPKGGDLSNIIQLVLAPNSNYNKILFTLSRDIYDYTNRNVDGFYGRRANIQVLKYGKIYNILQSLPGIDSFKKIGVQSHPGLLMCINGQDIRIGPSGIYQINNGYTVDFMGFVLSDDDYFILDYQY